VAEIAWGNNRTQVHQCRMQCVVNKRHVVFWPRRGVENGHRCRRCCAKSGEWAKKNNKRLLFPNSPEKRGKENVHHLRRTGEDGDQAKKGRKGASKKGAPGPGRLERAERGTPLEEKSGAGRAIDTKPILNRSKCAMSTIMSICCKKGLKTKRSPRGKPGEGGTIGRGKWSRWSPGGTILSRFVARACTSIENCSAPSSKESKKKDVRGRPKREGRRGKNHLRTYLRALRTSQLKKNLKSNHDLAKVTRQCTG